MNRRLFKSISVPLTAAALVVSLAACGGSDGSSAGVTDSDAPSVTATASTEVTVTDAWIRQPADGQTVAAGYATITNGSDQDITLVGADVAFVDDVQLHETTTDSNGVMSMQEKDGGFLIPAGQVFTLGPGGAHLMMMGVDPSEFTAGTTITISFDFDTGQVVDAEAEIRGVGAGDDSTGSMAPMGTDDMPMSTDG